jgi:hypothetical protein
MKEKTHQLFKENRPLPWSDVGMPSSGWYLNHLFVMVPPVSHDKRQRRYKIHRRQFTLSPDLHDDPAFALHSYNSSTFGT